VLFESLEKFFLLNNLQILNNPRWLEPFVRRTGTVKEKEKLPNCRFYILTTKAGRRRFFFPSLSEGKNNPLFILEDCFIRQLGLFVRGDEITVCDNESLP